MRDTVGSSGRPIEPGGCGGIEASTPSAAKPGTSFSVVTSIRWRLSRPAVLFLRRLVAIEHGAHRAVADRVNGNLQASAVGFDGHPRELLGREQRLAAPAGPVGIKSPSPSQTPYRARRAS
jgi:hypothetical protein